MTTPYQRGAGFERQVQDRLEKKGWLVIRSAASKSIVDLIALPRDGIRRPALIQCKLHHKGTVNERDELFQLAAEYGADGVWVYRLEGGKQEWRFKVLKLDGVEPWTP